MDRTVRGTIEMTAEMTIIGTLFRGPNWSWQEPWRKPPVMRESQ